MSLYFVTPGTIDLEAALTFGINAKVNSNPIGFFGTGLKYAIATLLRTGHDVTIHIGDDLPQLFKVKDKHFRGKEFQMVYLDDKPLGFTTELGKHWQVWMAFRELHSNTLDEEGFTTLGDGGTNHGPLDLPDSNTYTIIQVDGLEIERIYKNERHLIFCSSPLVSATNDVEVLAGSSKYLYYRGVRVHELEKPSVFTYNLLSEQKLTEDRTLSSTYSLRYNLGTAVARLKNSSCIAKMITASGISYESELDFSSCLDPSEEFLSAVKGSVGSVRLNQSARKLAVKFSAVEEKEIILNAVQAQQLERAVTFLSKVGFPIKDYSISVVNLAIGQAGEARDGKILLSVESFERGTKYVAETLFEEMIHLRNGVFDETRAMQDVLIREVMSIGEKLIGEPL